MQDQLHWRDFEVLVLRRKRQRWLGLQMRPFQPLRVVASYSCQQTDILKYLERNIDWIEKRQRKWARLVPPTPSQGLEGDLYWYLGNKLPLKFSVTLLQKPFVQILSFGDSTHGELRYFKTLPARGTASMTAQLEQSEVIHSAILQHLEAAAEAHLEKRVAFWSEQMNLQPKKLRFRNQKSRWGSCNSRGTVSLNRKLIGAPAEVIDSVVVHELAHLRHLNHSKDFWSLVESSIPNLRECELWLERHSLALL